MNKIETLSVESASSETLSSKEIEMLGSTVRSFARNVEGKDWGASLDNLRLLNLPGVNQLDDTAKETLREALVKVSANLMNIPNDGPDRGLRDDLKTYTDQAKDFLAKGPVLAC